MWSLAKHFGLLCCQSRSWSCNDLLSLHPECHKKNQDVQKERSGILIWNQEFPILRPKPTILHAQMFDVAQFVDKPQSIWVNVFCSTLEFAMENACTAVQQSHTVRHSAIFACENFLEFSFSWGWRTVDKVVWCELTCALSAGCCGQTFCTCAF